MYSFILAMCIAVMLALQPDFGQACLVLFAWGVMYFVAGAPILLLMGMAGLVVFGGRSPISILNTLPAALMGFFPDVDPRTQLGYATNAIQEGGFSALVWARGR